jgi:hypothetical protein
MERNTKLGIVLLATVAMLAANAFGQKSNEVAGLVGRNIIRDQSVSGTGAANPNIHFGDSLSYEGNFSHQFFNFGIAGVSVEVPFVVTPTTKMQFALNTVPKDFSSYFVTPAVRVNLFPTTAFSPWGSIGGGVGHFSPNAQLEFGGPSNGTDTTGGVFEAGIGLDVRVAGPIKIRGEFRDFNASASSALNAGRGTKRLNVLFAGAGIVFSF